MVEGQEVSVNQPWWIEWAAPLAAALLARTMCSFVLLHDMQLVSDAAAYDQVARSLLVDFPGRRAYYWPPGNAFLLAGAYAALGAHLLVTRAILCIVHLTSVVLVGLIARRAVPSGARATVWLASLYPPAVMLAGQPYAQHLATTCLLGVAYWGLLALTEQRMRAAALAGLCLGLGCITRPSLAAAAFAVLVGAWTAFRTSCHRCWTVAISAVLALLTSLTVMPIVAHNRSCGAGNVLSTNNERNFFLGNTPYTPDYKTSHLAQRRMSDLPADTQQYLNKHTQAPDARRVMQDEALRYIRQHPGRTLYRSFNRVLAFWGFDYLASRIIQTHFRLGRRSAAYFLPLEAGGYVLLMLLAIAGLLHSRDYTIRAWRRWLIGLVVAGMAPYAITFSSGTYHYPTVWLLMPFAGLAIARMRAEGLRFLRRPMLWVLWALFLLVQIQYGYWAVTMAD